MFLKRIVLHGFKSFADRTEFEFGPGLTAIVGPNGCGKSNVVDAVRWVLGEQSAKSLRGGKMSDVIFAGSRSRKPATFAEVQLTFDNRSRILRHDQDEVVVGRTLYASGDSEYRLNGNACRLKDVRDLLLDTGVGVDAYSFIEQGRVDRLLQASPLERREIFEEAAGISRYKVRRIEAQRKLERTQNNLLRLQDILEELEKRLRSVRLAAGKARNFQEYDRRLRELRSTYSLAEFHELEQRRQRLAAEIERLQAAEQDERAALAASDAEAAERSHALQALDDQIQAAEGELLQLQSELSALDERIAQTERRCDELESTRQRRRAQSAEMEQRLAALEERVRAEQAGLAALESAEGACAARIADVAAARQHAAARTEDSRASLEQEKAAAYEAVRRATLLQNERQNLGQQQQRLARQVERLQTRRAELAAEGAALDERRSALDGQVAEVDGALGQRGGELHDVEQRVAVLEGDLAALEGDIGQAKEERSALVTRLALLEDLERRLEGVDQGTRDVLAWRAEAELRDAVLGLVADLLRIDDPRVGLLQPVLSTFENHVVVRDAAAFAARLAERGGPSGPIRVLALERIAPRRALLRYDGVPGVVARAADWVRCAEEHRPLAEHLLGRTVVVESLARALELAREAPVGYTFVTLAGEVVGTDARLTFGGAAGEGTGLISRKAEIRQLQVERDDVETRLEQFQRRRAALEAEVGDARLRRGGLLDEIATLQRQHAELRSALNHLAEQQRRHAREAQVVDDELRGEQASLARLRQQTEALATETQAVDEAQRTHESRVDSLGRELDELEAALRRLAQEHTDALVEKGRIAEKRAATQEAVGELQARVESSGVERAAAEREAEEAAREIARAREDLEAARQQRAACDRACTARREEILALREERTVLRQRVEECGAVAREHQRRLETLDSALHEQQVQRREAEVRSETLVARVRDELGLDLAARYAEYEHQDQDWSGIQAEIEELKGKIARLGHVNLDALAELEELTPRYEHLVSQRDDLQDAIARLGALIEELDEESRTRFAATFDEVRGNFQEMFRKLFGGGKADVILEDPESPLECGIEIIARPPGKEPQSISLLSGGEKTLTAVALVMAIFKSRPSPFTILDEVDAALDEANVGRFNMVLGDFLSQTQFVVITHSKRTMASVDVLYGITMEEPGVSKRVSVRFEDRVFTPSVA